MTSAAKAKGSQFERDVAAVLLEAGFAYVERRYGAGATMDKGDINGIRGVVIECKNLKAITLSSIMDESAAERDNAGADLGLAVIKRRGKNAEHAYAVLPLHEMAKLLKKAGYE